MRGPGIGDFLVTGDNQRTAASFAAQAGLATANVFSEVRPEQKAELIRLWAFFYTAVGVPLAALGFLSPVLCAAGMGFSELIVIGNALRLLRWNTR